MTKEKAEAIKQTKNKIASHQRWLRENPYCASTENYHADHAREEIAKLKSQLATLQGKPQPKTYEMVVDLQSVRITITEEEHKALHKGGNILPSVHLKVRREMNRRINSDGHLIEQIEEL